MKLLFRETVRSSGPSFVFWTKGRMLTRRRSRAQSIEAVESTTTVPLPLDEQPDNQKRRRKETLGNHSSSTRCRRPVTTTRAVVFAALPTDIHLLIFMHLKPVDVTPFLWINKNLAQLTRESSYWSWYAKRIDKFQEHWIDTTLAFNLDLEFHSLSSTSSTIKKKKKKKTRKKDDAPAVSPFDTVVTPRLVWLATQVACCKCARRLVVDEHKRRCDQCTTKSAQDLEDEEFCQKEAIQMLGLPPAWKDKVPWREYDVGRGRVRFGAKRREILAVSIAFYGCSEAVYYRARHDPSFRRAYLRNLPEAREEREHEAKVRAQQDEWILSKWFPLLNLPNVFKELKEGGGDATSQTTTTTTLSSSSSSRKPMFKIPQMKTRRAEFIALCLESLIEAKTEDKLLLLPHSSHCQTEVDDLKRRRGQEKLRLKVRREQDDFIQRQWLPIIEAANAHTEAKTTTTTTAIVIPCSDVEREAFIRRCFDIVRAHALDQQQRVEEDKASRSSSVSDGMDMSSLDIMCLPHSDEFQRVADRARDEARARIRDRQLRPIQDEFIKRKWLPFLDLALICREMDILTLPSNATELLNDGLLRRRFIRTCVERLYAQYRAAQKTDKTTASTTTTIASLDQLLLPGCFECQAFFDKVKVATITSRTAGHPPSCLSCRRNPRARECSQGMCGYCCIDTNCYRHRRNHRHRN